MDKYGLIGHPLKHSFSQRYFNDKFKAEGIKAEYVNFDIVSIAEIKTIIESNPELLGLNVTIPYKEQVIPYLDELSENAKNIGAVNVIKIVRDKKKIKLIGYNSDIIGFKESIEPLLQPYHKRALILGSGGAAKAVFHGLKQLGIESIFVSRIKEGGMITYEELSSEVMKIYSIVINCTPLGMFPNVDEYPAIPYDLLNTNHLIYDLLYNPNETLFMKKSKERGATVKNGLEMLLLQAFVSWEFWQSIRGR